MDLLPPPTVSQWTGPLPTDDGQEQDQIFGFDGLTNAIEIPGTKLNHTLNQHFTISTWMRHEQNVDDNSKKGVKEHIMCNADGESKYNCVKFDMVFHDILLFGKNQMR